MHVNWTGFALPLAHPIIEESGAVMGLRAFMPRFTMPLDSPDYIRAAVFARRTTSSSGISVTPTSRGQIMYSLDGSTFTAETPLVTDDTGEIITEDDTGYIVVMG